MLTFPVCAFNMVLHFPYTDNSSYSGHTTKDGLLPTDSEINVIVEEAESKDLEMGVGTTVVLSA